MKNQKLRIGLDIDDTILDFLAQAKFPKYTNEQIDASIPPDEFYPDIVE